ncbi:hypothetical protein E3N88_38699 [Mikania micrantha]|uniref:Reverse transcriptase domain-containing protein n=1 Tax=Mikania micrantha TaxID=192012 RepID=A0A5N6LX95_9ASTR|nr:hypothetical protein E3N88_38699 [Mikania micrantha]
MWRVASTHFWLNTTEFQTISSITTKDPVAVSLRPLPATAPASSSDNYRPGRKTEARNSVKIRRQVASLSAVDGIGLKQIQLLELLQQNKNVGGNPQNKNVSEVLNMTPTPLDYKYTIELANGKLIETQHIFKGCVLVLADHGLEIDLMPVTLGSFDVVAGMDWLSDNQAEIVCNENIVRVTLPSGEQISIQGERRGIPLNIISCMKASKYLQKGYTAILALITGQSKKERRIEDIIVLPFQNIFNQLL